MALEGIRYDTNIQDIIWDDGAGGPALESLTPKICRDLVEILWVRTEFTRNVGRPNIGTLARTQVQLDQSRAILENQQATQTGLEDGEIISNFRITDAEIVRQTPTTISWQLTLEFRGGSTTSVNVVTA